MLSLLLNILWFVLGGFAAGLGWMVGAMVLALTIVGLPWVPAVFRIGLFAFAPFGRHAVPREAVNGHGDLGTGCLGAGLNAIWFIFAGWWIALTHLIIGVVQGLTIIGIPFAVQHFKLAALAIAPVGKTLRP
ncbi:MAG: YccF domain-containing protein [Caulobacteraceae bacterium]